MQRCLASVDGMSMLDTVPRLTYLAHVGAARAESSLVRSSLSSLADFIAAPQTECSYFLSSDGRSGFFIHGSIIRGLFSLERGRGDLLVTEAIRAGGRHLECYDGYLTDLYGRHGFVETAREANWTPGKPDVVWMRWEDRRAQ